MFFRAVEAADICPDDAQNFRTQWIECARFRSHSERSRIRNWHPEFISLNRWQELKREPKQTLPEAPSRRKGE